MPIEEFVSRFVSPVVLVGPGSPREIRLNPPAALISERLGLADWQYAPVRPPGIGQDSEGSDRLVTLGAG